MHIDECLLELRLRQALPTVRDVQELLASSGAALTEEQAWALLKRQAVEARRELARLDREARRDGRAVAPGLQLFKAWLSDAMWDSPELADEARRLFSVKAKRGAPRKPEEWHFVTAVEYAARLRANVPPKVAVYEVAELRGCTEAVVRNAHAKWKNKREVEIELAHRAMPVSDGRSSE